MRIRSLLSIIVVCLVSVILATPAMAYAVQYTEKTALLNGLSEVPPNLSPATAQASFNVTPDVSSIHYRVVANNLTGVITASHIHLAPLGVNGAVVVTLVPFIGGISEGDIMAANLQGALAGQPLSALDSAMDAGNTYVNVHTTLFPAGEIRGQIQPLFPDIRVAKTVGLSKDADGDGVISPGDTLRYTNQIRNTGNGTALGVMFSDTPDMKTSLVVDSVTTTSGFVTKGNIPGNTVEVNVGDIAPLSQVIITFDVTINNPLWESHVANQAIVKGANFATLKSDDPVTAQPEDATMVKVKTSPPVHGPGVSTPGILALTALLGGAMVWMKRRKQIQSGIN